MTKLLEEAIDHLRDLPEEELDGTTRLATDKQNGHVRKRSQV
jgi:hypothetical protein